MTTIRPLRRTDIDELQAMDRIAHGEAWSTAAFNDQIDKPKYQHLVAEDTNGALMGHAGTWQDNDVLRITNVAVAPEAAGNGVATALLLDLLGDPRHSTRIELEVRPRNRGAQRLYNRFGFAPVGIVRNFYERSDDSGSRDALVMEIAEPRSAAWRDRIAQLTQAQRPPNQTDRKGEAA